MSNIKISAMMNQHMKQTIQQEQVKPRKANQSILEQSLNQLHNNHLHHHHLHQLRNKASQGE